MDGEEGARAQHTSGTEVGGARVGGLLYGGAGGEELTVPRMEHYKVLGQREFYRETRT